MVYLLKFANEFTLHTHTPIFIDAERICIAFSRDVLCCGSCYNQIELNNEGTNMFGSDFHENCQNESCINDNNEKCARHSMYIRLCVWVCVRSIFGRTCEWAHNKCCSIWFWFFFFSFLLGWIALKVVLCTSESVSHWHFTFQTALPTLHIIICGTMLHASTYKHTHTWKYKEARVCGEPFEIHNSYFHIMPKYISGTFVTSQTI